MNEDSFIRRLRITRIIIETNDSRTFLLEPLDNWTPVYEAGQFLTLVFYTRHGEKRRSYSISSSPVMGEPLSITIKKIDNGEFSRLLVYQAKEGDILLSSGIGGHFILPDHYAKNFKQYFFLAAGSGITPCFPIIKSILTTTDSEVILIYSNRCEEETIFYNAILELQKTYSNFKVRFLFSNVPHVKRSRLSNLLLQELLEEYISTDFRQVLCFLCGPFEYMRMIEITLSGKIPRENILKENYNSLPRLVIPRPPDTEPHTATIIFMEKVYSFPVQYPKTILAAAKEKKIQLPYSCEAGRCASCVATCTKGSTWMAYNEVLTDSEVDAGRVLVCQAFPVGGHVEIRY